METKFAEFMSNENERLERDVQQAAEKSAADLAERAQHRADEWAAITRSRTQQLDLRAAHAAQERLADQRFVRAWKVPPPPLPPFRRACAPALLPTPFLAAAWG
jgi:hypothetical protein